MVLFSTHPPLAARVTALCTGDRLERFVARVTTAFGVGLIGLGVIAYVGTAAVSVTARIPAIFGAVLVLLGWFAGHERYRKHAVRLAVAVGLVGFLGAVPGLIGLWDLISGAEVQRPAAVVSQSFMAILMAVFVGLCVRSFIGESRTIVGGE
jgi:FtsH-binding integral membrane protein